jgi:protein TonB
MQNIDLPQDVPPPPPPPEDVPPPPPPPADEVKSVNDTKKFTEPEIAKKEEVVEEIAKQEDFKEGKTTFTDGRPDVPPERKDTPK